jgi:hypothetical protein
MPTKPAETVETKPELPEKLTVVSHLRRVVSMPGVGSGLPIDGAKAGEKAVERWNISAPVMVRPGSNVLSTTLLQAHRNTPAVRDCLFDGATGGWEIVREGEEGGGEDGSFHEDMLQALYAGQEIPSEKKRHCAARKRQAEIDELQQRMERKQPMKRLDKEA